MKNLQITMREIYDDLPKLDDTEFMIKTRYLLNGKSKSSVLVAIFLEFQSSISAALLMNLGFWFESIEYKDIIEAMLKLGNTGLPAYHFAGYVPEIFGVDIRQAAWDIQNQHPTEKEKVRYFAELKELIGPSRHAIEHLKDAGASPEKIRDSLRNSGAPLLPLPDMA